MWQIRIDKSNPILSFRDKTVTRRWWWRGEEGRLWTHFTHSNSSLLPAAAPRCVSLLWWKTWRLILPPWTCPWAGDCRRLRCCSGFSPSLAWVSVRVYACVHWKHLGMMECFNGTALFVKDKSTVILCCFTVGEVQTYWPSLLLGKVQVNWKVEKCWKPE